MPRRQKKSAILYIVAGTGHDSDDDDDEEYSEDEDDDDDFIVDDSSEADEQIIKRKVSFTPKKVVPLSQKIKIKRGKPIQNLTDLIEALQHPQADDDQKKLLEALNELNSMIGMSTMKEQIVNQILFFIQDLHEPNMFLHTVLTGPPGCGKTTIITILAKMYSSLGIVGTDKIVKAERSDLVGKYLGSTAIKTKKVLDSARGGILVLDEVYALGNNEQSDSFSKECIDTINQFLSEHAHELICIVAGYKENVDQCFFGYNQGLARRFPWRFNVDEYKVSDLHKIMRLQVLSSGWDMDVLDDDINHLIQTNRELFHGNGGDTKNLIDKCKIAYARRIFTEEEKTETVRKGRRKIQVPIKPAKKLIKIDIQVGFKAFQESKKSSNSTIDEHIRNSMYL